MALIQKTRGIVRGRVDLVQIIIYADLAIKNPLLGPLDIWDSFNHCALNFFLENLRLQTAINAAKIFPTYWLNKAVSFGPR